MTSKKFCDDKVLVVFLYIELIGTLLTAHGYSPIWLTWPMRIVALVTAIALTLLIKSQIRSQGQVTMVCIGLALQYGLQVVGTCEVTARLKVLQVVTFQRIMLFLSFAIFAIIMLAQSTIYLSYNKDTGFFEKVQCFLRTRSWIIVSTVLFVACFLVYWIYLGSDMLRFKAKGGDLNPILGGYLYLWLQDLLSRGIVCFAYFRSITWYKHVGQIASPEK